MVAKKKILHTRKRRGVFMGGVHKWRSNLSSPQVMYLLVLAHRVQITQKEKVRLRLSDYLAISLKDHRSYFYAWEESKGKWRRSSENIVTDAKLKEMKWRTGEGNGWRCMLLESEGCHGDWSGTRRRPVSIDTLLASAPMRCAMEQWPSSENSGESRCETWIPLLQLLTCLLNEPAPLLTANHETIWMTVKSLSTDSLFVCMYGSARVCGYA